MKLNFAYEKNKEFNDSIIEVSIHPLKTQFS